MNCILLKVVDNYAEIIDDENKGSVREIFEHYATKSMQIKEQEDIGFRMDIGTGYLFFSGFKEAYHIYFSKKILRNDFKTNLAELITPHLEPIDYDCWAKLEFNDELTGAEMEEKQTMEESNMAVIEMVYQRLKDDEEIQGRIRQIQAHPWVRVVEGE